MCVPWVVHVNDTSAYYINHDGPISFCADVSRPKMSDQHNILSITEQSLKRYKKSLMTQYIFVLRYQFTLYAIIVVADLAMI